jgi:hypothetical protein
MDALGKAGMGHWMTTGRPDFTIVTVDNNRYIFTFPDEQAYKAIIVGSTIEFLPDSTSGWTNWSSDNVWTLERPCT